MAEHASHGGSADDQYLETPPGAGYEHTDADIGPLLKFAFWLAVCVVGVHVGMGVMYTLLIRTSAQPPSAAQYPLATNQVPRLPPQPRLQESGARDMYAFRQGEEAELHSYGWVDKGAGTVRIPIDDAMRLLLERGLPSREAAAAGAAAPFGLMPSDSSAGRLLEKRRQ